MRYIDSGERDPSQALGTWLQAELTPDVTELRWQSGFFSVDGLPPLLSTLQRLAATDKLVHGVIGSNDSNTLATHVAQLTRILGLPRTSAKLGVIQYAGAFYHPKTYHLRRSDGTQAAYIGSANLTAAGVGALHVEAGLIVDTREGAPAALLDEIAAAVDAWFSGTRKGIELIYGPADVTRLEALGLLSAAAPPAPAAGGASGGLGAGGRSGRPRLQALFPLPPIGGGDGQGARPAGGQGGTGGTVPPLNQPPTPGTLPVGPQPGYPAYVLFAPGATTPTRGAAALSGATLPGGYIGVITRLSKDSARPWAGGDGTTNFSLPIPTMETLRFGRLDRGSRRPRAEIDMEVRYLHTGGEIRAAIVNTNVMIYGYEPGRKGNKDRRLVVPRGVALELLAPIQKLQLAVPAAGDPVLLEWPTLARPSFRVTLLQRGSPLAQQAEATLAGAPAQGTAVGRGACWLVPGFSPSW